MAQNHGGALAIIGGRLESDNAAVFAALGGLCGGRIAVLSMASGSPREVGAELVADFAAHGILADAIELYWEERDSAAFDERLVARIAACGSVFFSGGDQSRILETLVHNGAETPVLACIRRLHAAGGLLAGSSAGAAIMSQTMILGGTSLEAITRGPGRPDAEGFALGPGLGFFPWGIVDQHFLQRGRIGRLLIAARHSGAALGFGIDENTALLVSNGIATVCGETGVLLVDLRAAHFDADGYAMRGVRISYLDDGDAFDLEQARILPAVDKQPVAVREASYRHPALVRRHAFASYALHDLMLRLVEADPAHYAHDRALADDEESGLRIAMEIARVPGRSRALRAVRADGEIRYSALEFELGVRSYVLDPLDAEPATSVMLPPAPSRESRLVLLGSSPVGWRAEHLADLLAQLREPVGILALASSHPRRVGRQYLEWVRAQGLQGELLDVSHDNIERAGGDRELLTRIQSMGSLLLTGGDQRLLTDTLLHCAEATPVLHAIVRAYENGVALIAVAAAASACAERMIVEGDSAAALRLGASEDAGFEGLVVEPGLGLVDCGIIDQNFLNRHRLGRLLVACARTGSRHGFGLCEESGMVISGNERSVRAIGRTGIVIAELDPARVRLEPPAFDPRGIGLHFVEPGASFALDAVPATREPAADTGMAMLERAVRDLARDCNSARARNTPAVDGSVLRSALISGARV